MIGEFSPSPGQSFIVNDEAMTSVHDIERTETKLGTEGWSKSRLVEYSDLVSDISFEKTSESSRHDADLYIKSDKPP